MKRLVKWYPVILMITISLAFAISNILLKKIISDGVDHLVFITYRQSVSAIFLAPLAYFLERKTRPELKPSTLCHLFVSAMIGASLPLYLFLLGIQYTSATFACAFNNMVPVFTFLMALVIRLETVNIKCSSGRAKVIGALVCLGGAILLTVYKGVPLFHFSDTHSTERHHKPDMHGKWAIGSALMVLGTFCWSSWYLLQAKIGKSYPCQYSSTAIMVTFSAVQSAVLSLSVDRKLSIWILKSKMDILITMYSGIVGSGLCFVGLSWCVKKRGPVFTAAFSPLIQIMAAMFDVPFLHGQFYLGSLLGSIIVIAGLYILLWGKDKEMQKKETNLGGAKSQGPELQVIKVEAEPEHP